MEKDKIFFAESGLTSTSANYVANMAKEMYRGLETRLNNIVFYTTSVKLLGTSEESLLQQGVDSVDNVAEDLHTIGERKSLIGWLREAIKAREAMLGEIAALRTYEDYGIEVPKRPVRDKSMTADDYVATMNIKRRNRYYYLEAMCATIGQYVHPDGWYAKARQALTDIMSKPHEVSGQGRDTLMYTREPSVDPERVEMTFMELQDQHRTYQAELNSMKHEIDEAVRKDASDKLLEYNAALAVYNNKMEAAERELEAKTKAEEAAVSALKIVIPDSLKPMYERVQATLKNNKK